MIRVLSDILGALDRGEFAVLTLLDLSAAIDTVDHTTLLRRLQTTYGITDTALALAWFFSYLQERKQSVCYRGKQSSLAAVLCGVTQGSVLGPILFLLCELQRIIENMQLRPHMYADDTQIYGFCVPAEVSALEQRMSTCIDRVADWMRCS